MCAMLCYVYRVIYRLHEKYVDSHHSSLRGCSKCMKSFPCESFCKKSDYSGYNRHSWPVRTNSLHKEHILKYNDACTTTDHCELERKYGVRYSELLRLP